jgi:hypothetical protein
MCEAALDWTRDAPIDSLAAREALFVRELHAAFPPPRESLPPAFVQCAADFFKTQLAPQLVSVTHRLAMREHAFFGLTHAAQVVTIVHGFVNKQLLGDWEAYEDACALEVPFGEEPMPLDGKPRPAIRLVLDTIDEIAKDTAATAEAAWTVFASALFAPMASGPSPMTWISDAQLCEVTRGTNPRAFAYPSSAPWCLLRFFLSNLGKHAAEDMSAFDAEAQLRGATDLNTRLRAQFRPGVGFPPCNLPMLSLDTCVSRLSRIFATDEATVRQAVFMTGPANAGIGRILPSQKATSSRTQDKYALAGIVFWLTEGLARGVVFAPAKAARLRAFQVRCARRAMFVRAQVQLALEAAHTAHDAGVDTARIGRTSPRMLAGVLLDALHICLARYNIAAQDTAWGMCWARATAVCASEGVALPANVPACIQTLARACAPARGVLTLLPLIQFLCADRTVHEGCTLPQKCPVAQLPLAHTVAQTAHAFCRAQDDVVRALPSRATRIACSGLNDTAAHTPTNLRALKPCVYNLRTRTAVLDLQSAVALGTTPEPAHLALNLLCLVDFGDASEPVTAGASKRWSSSRAAEYATADMLVAALLWRLGQDVRTEASAALWPAVPSVVTTYGKKRARTEVASCCACFEPCTPAEPDDSSAARACTHLMCTACTVRLLESRARAFLARAQHAETGTFRACGPAVLRCGIDGCCASLAWALELLSCDIRFALRAAQAEVPLPAGHVECGICWGAAVLDDADGVVATCATCGLQTCVQCLTPVHFGVVCPAAQAASQRPENILTEAKMQACPACATNTIKDDGCNHMTCKCGCQWCWVCGHALPTPAESHYQLPSPCSQFMYSRNTETTRIRARIEARADLPEEARAHALHLLATTFAQETHDI